MGLKGSKGTNSIEKDRTILFGDVGFLTILKNYPNTTLSLVKPALNSFTKNNTFLILRSHLKK